jgi:hypothetical protein
MCAWRRHGRIGAAAAWALALGACSQAELATTGKRDAGAADAQPRVVDAGSVRDGAADARAFDFGAVRDAATPPDEGVAATTDLGPSGSNDAAMTGGPGEGMPGGPGEMMGGPGGMMGGPGGSPPSEPPPPPPPVCDPALDPDEPVADASFAVGIADSNPATFTHPAFRLLNVTRARAVAPYDVAQRAPGDGGPRDRLDQWLAAAAAAGVEPMVTLGPSDLHRAADQRYVAPSPGEYVAAFAAFHATYPGVHLVAAWNEPNFGDTVLASGPGMADTGCSPADDAHCGPILAARYYGIVSDACPECTVAAGEFDATPSATGYWNLYKRGLGDRRPALWSLHTHHDVNEYQANAHHCQAGDGGCTTRSFVEWLDGLGREWRHGHVWMTEVGAFYRGPDDHVWGEQSQRDAVAFLLRLPSISSRITRIYYYDFQNHCSSGDHCAHQDRGLVSPDTTDGSGTAYDGFCHVRAAFHVIRDRDTRGP